MKIRSLDTTTTPLLIAEIGNNHEGDFALAERLVRQAAECGVGAVKFQTFRTEQFVSRADPARFNRLKSFELTPRQFRRLAELSRSLGLPFVSTPLDLESARDLEPIVDAYKIASGDNNFFPLLRQVARTRKPVIVSSGVSDLRTVRAAVRCVRSEWTRMRHDGQLFVLHCVSSYPAPVDQANLRSIPFLQRKLSLPIGYSDHTVGLDAAVVACALGAQIIEKHFTLDKHYSDYRDHQLSADPDEMTALVGRLRLVASLLGAETKAVMPCEAGSAALIRRSIVAKTDLRQGHRITEEDLTWLRPAHGLPPGKERAVLGRILRTPLRAGDPIVPRVLR